MEISKTKNLIIAALLAALTCIATMVIQIPTLSGYIHLGDSLVILCGIILGPVTGGISAGIGSMMADLLSGYFIPYGPATLLIKALAAFSAGYLFHGLSKSSKLNINILVLLSGAVSGIIVVIGYGIFGIAVYGLSAGITTILPNFVQVSAGILGAFLLYPIISKIPDVRGKLIQKQ